MDIILPLKWRIAMLYEIYNSFEHSGVGKPVGSWTWDEVYQSIEPKCISDTVIQPTDPEYEKYTFSDIQMLASLCIVSKRKYIKNKFECENFAFSFYDIAEALMPGCALGIVITTSADFKISHAINCFVDHFGNFWFIEPQNDKIFKELSESAVVGEDAYIKLIII